MMRGSRAAQALLFIFNIAIGHALSLNNNLQTALPPQLREASARGLLVQPRPNAYILGTVHIGSKSADEARLLIDAVRPTAVVVEVSPSRVPLIRKRNAASERNALSKQEDVEVQGSDGSGSGKIWAALGSLPALAQKGWYTGGFAGLAFSIVILWGSLLKRSLTVKEEETSLPRSDEFAATIAAADAINATVLAPDVEIDELLASVARSMSSPIDWISLGTNIARESVGLREPDPIRRRRREEESIVEWANRRRNIDTARASRLHGEGMAPGISRAMVEERDERFARSCLEALGGNEDDDATVIVCVVGLVHLDGVVERLKRVESK
mmetsp:Transcript_24358/g.44028  ORF Transcript_24358/g.44028 Transcript_24358/m.44028 type:complete len:327 (+) Transcript_24358:34-1014(+)